MRALIFANGIIKNPSRIQSNLRDGDLIIAADGGANHCHELNITPAVVIGDLDSISDELHNLLKDREVKFIIYPKDKDQTDLELALSFAYQQRVNEVHFYGVLGGRLDLSLSNLLLLARDDWEPLSLVVVDEPDIAYVLRNGNTISFTGNPGDIISLIPLSEKVQGVSTEGLRWKLDGAVLSMGSTLSVSNELLEHSGQVKIGVGTLLLVHREMVNVTRQE
ncbi:MAG: thiamine diphosphokinase [Anaerolineales bacterium]